MTDFNELPMATVFLSTGTEIELRIDAARDTVWATKKQIAEAFGCDETNVIKHIQEIYASGEADEGATSEESSVVQVEGGRSVIRTVSQYNLDVILLVGFRVNGKAASDFRRGAAAVLKDFLTKGFALNGAILANSPEAQQALYEHLRAIRLKETNVYARVRDVFKASASDYSPSSPTAKGFFAMAQDKFHYAITGKTAAQIVLARADAKRPNLGMTSDQALLTFETAKVAKNYLSADELRGLENISEQFLLFAESKAFRRQPMTMEELQFRLNTLLAANDYPVLFEYESYQRDKADAHVRKQLAEHKKLGAPGPRKQLSAEGE